MLSDAELDQARADLEAELLDVVSVWRRDGETTDPVTYEPIPNWTPIVQPTVVDDVAQPNALVVREPQHHTVAVQGDAPQATRMYSVTLPVADEVKVEDVMLIEQCHDPAAHGTTLTVKDPQYGTLSISRRVRCQANQSFPVGLPEAGS